MVRKIMQILFPKYGSPLYLLLFLYLSGCGLKVEAIHHDEQKAAKKALEFAKIAFVSQDYTYAYAMTSKHFMDKFSLDNFRQTILEMHKNVFPATVHATDFEPMLGQKSMLIYIVGENDNKKLYYKVVLDGTADADYKISGFYKKDSPYPKTSLRKSL